MHAQILYVLISGWNCKIIFRLSRPHFWQNFGDWSSEDKEQVV